MPFSQGLIRRLCGLMCEVYQGPNGLPLFSGIENHYPFGYNGSHLPCMLWLTLFLGIDTVGDGYGE